MAEAEKALADVVLERRQCATTSSALTDNAERAQPRHNRAGERKRVLAKSEVYERRKNDR
jgi:hypothetical protein